MTDNINKILELLPDMYPDARPELIYNNAFELLIAAMLSAQCTDKRVNIVTKKLFELYPSPYDYIRLDKDELEQLIMPCGLYHTKAKNILAACEMLVDKFDGQVPANRDDLIKLPGVGRKVANVVISNAYSVPAIAVDTHVFRVANRLGLADANTPEKTEKQLMDNIPIELWSIAHHWLIFHGRRCCKAQKPMCSECALADYCKSYNQTDKK